VLVVRSEIASLARVITLNYAVITPLVLPVIGDGVPRGGRMGEVDGRDPKAGKRRREGFLF
jgi:hypothetical protein